ncbi:MAG: DAK2 domain-containing protein [Candidatus Nanopelagicales bacterium]
MHDTIDAAVVRLWAAAALSGLGEHRAEIDALNVFPVPDGDTGTNLFLTVESAAQYVEELYGDAAEPTLAQSVTAFAQGALLGARGNSGVITSQLLRGIADVLTAESATGGSEDLAGALTRAAELAYGAVAVPREGTVLSVAKAAAFSARESATADASLAAVARAAVAGAQVALDHTPEQLQVLKDAGVVDSGGKGLVVILEALVEAITGEHRVSHPDVRLARPVTSVESHSVTYGGPAYEVMFLLDADDRSVPAMKEALAALGDSLVVVGGGGLWNIHVHVDDVGAAIEAGIEAGRPYRIKVTHLELADDLRRSGRDGSDLPGEDTRTGRALVAVAHGPGVATLLQESGVTTVAAKPGRRPSTAELLDGVKRSGAREVIILPSDGDTRIVAEAAAEQARNDGIRVAVIPTRSVVQTLAAAAVHDPGAHFDDDLVAMGRSSASTRYGAVTVAVRQAVTTAGMCQVGDVLGLLDGDIVEIEPTVSEASVAIVRRMLDRGGELLTIVAGEDADEALLADVSDAAELASPEVEVEIVHGGQPLWPLIIGLE